MAAEGEFKEDMKAHAKSYERFAWMMKWGAIAAFIVGMIVVFIIAD